MKRKMIMATFIEQTIFIKTEVPVIASFFERENLCENKLETIPTKEISAKKSMLVSNLESHPPAIILAVIKNRKL